MRIEKTDANLPKGWYLGPWNAALDISVGYAHTGVDEPHFHREMFEIYLMASGTVEMRVEAQTLSLDPNQVVVIEPGEAHTFLSSSACANYPTERDPFMLLSWTRLSTISPVRKAPTTTVRRTGCEPRSWAAGSSPTSAWWRPI